MVFDLFNTYQTKRSVASTVIKDCKLPELLSMVLDNEMSVIKFIEFLQLSTDKTEIIYRQEFFREIITSQVNRSYLREIQLGFRDLRKSIEIYQAEKDNYIGLFLFYKLIKSYIGFAKRLNENPVNVNSVKSVIMKNLIISINNAFNSKEVEQLYSLIDIVEQELDSINGINIDFRIDGAFITGHDNINYGIKKNMIDSLNELVNEMGIEVEYKAINNSYSISVVNQYIRYIILHNNVLLDKLEEFYRIYKNLLTELNSLNIDDINIVIDCIALHDLLNDNNIPITYPSISDDNHIDICDGYDISLIIQGVKKIVPNDFSFTPEKKLQLLAGANGGGKTSYLRTLGICAVLFSAGLFIPAKSADISCFDRILTHFAQDENKNYNDGRFVNERNAIINCIPELTSKSLILFNELYSSTDENTAFDEYRSLINKIEAVKCFSIIITHFNKVIDYYSNKNEYTVLSVAVNEDTGERTYKVYCSSYKKSYVEDILLKYSLTKDGLKKRLINQVRWEVTES
jgi:DNA mismatch repair ATPase MutS